MLQTATGRHPTSARFLAGAALLAAASLVPGCGGGNNGPAPPASARVQVDIQWAARSRQLSAPSSALSAVITLQRAALNGSDFTFTVNRLAAPAAYTRIETSPTAAQLGTWPLQAQFYAQPNGAGSLVGTAAVEVLLQKDGTLANPSGGALGVIQTLGTIATVQIPPSQQITIGQTASISATALDTANNVIAVSPGSVVVQVTSGPSFVQLVNGQVKGVAVGQATVTATIDGKVSNSQTVTVVSSNTSTSTAINLQANDIVYSPLTKLIYASVPSAAGGSVGNTITAIDPATAKIVASAPIGSEPGPLALSDDGHTLYVGLNGAAAVRRMDVRSMTAGIQFGLGSDSFSGARYPGQLAVPPGQPNSVAVSMDYSNQEPNFAGISIFDNGVARQNSISSYPTEINSIAFGANAATLYGFDNDSTAYYFTRMSVNAQGVSLVDSTGNLISGFLSTITFQNGLVYASNGQVLDPASLQLVGAYNSTTASTSGPAASTYALTPDSSSNRVYAFSVGFGESSGTLTVFNQQTFVPIATMSIPVSSTLSSNTPPQIVKWGTNGLAINLTNGQIVLVTPIPSK